MNVIIVVEFITISTILYSKFQKEYLYRSLTRQVKELSQVTIVL